MKIKKEYVLTALILLNLSCSTDTKTSVTPATPAVVKASEFIPETPPDFAIADSVVQQGSLVPVDGQEIIEILFPVVGVKIKNGQMRLNEDILVTNDNVPIESQSNIYGNEGLIIDTKKNGITAVDFAGIELKNEIIPPLSLSGNLLVSVTIRDLNAETTAKFDKNFKSSSSPLPAPPCSTTAKNTVSVSQPEVPCYKVIKDYRNGDFEYFRPGFDKVTPEVSLGTDIIGTWAITTPHLNWFGSVSQDPTDPDNIGKGNYGDLTLSEDKNFLWDINGNIGEGKMEQVIPRNNVVPGIIYWKISKDDIDYYIYVKNDSLYIINADTHFYVLIGKRIL